MKMKAEYKKYEDRNVSSGVDTCWLDPFFTEAGEPMSQSDIWEELFYPVRKKFVMQHCGYGFPNSPKPPCYNPRHLYITTAKSARYAGIEPTAAFETKYRRGKLSAEDVRRVFRLYYGGANQTLIGTYVGLDQTAVGDVLHRMTYRDVVPYDERHYINGLTLDNIMLIRLAAENVGYIPNGYFPANTEDPVIEELSRHFGVPYDELYRVISNYTYQYPEYMPETANPRRKMVVWARYLSNDATRFEWDELLKRIKSRTS
jgi:hypothetical protein